MNVMTNPVSKAGAEDASRRANALRFLAAEMVEKAKSGHPGMPLGMADIATALWDPKGSAAVRHDPADPTWWNRDRVVISNGHGSTLLYAALHLTGYDLSVKDLAGFRQMGSRTPGHPEVDVTPGVETTTGPLGQGLANGVGMALAEKQLAETFNREGFPVVDHHTFVLLGDGCLMEGISHEVCSMAGLLGLGKLICLWDDNGISIDGNVEGWFGDDTPARFEAYGWHVIRAVDGHDAAVVASALAEARAEAAKPTLICCRTVIGQGAPTKAGSHDVHGAPLGTEELAAMREALDWPHAPFEVPDDIREAWDARPAGAAARSRWDRVWKGYQATHPEAARELDRRMVGWLPGDWSEIVAQTLAAAAAEESAPATRKCSQTVLGRIAPRLPELFGGSADLTGSNLTDWKGAGRVNDKDPGGRYMSHGVREFGMSAILNGMALHGGWIPFGGTFLVFSDYARNAIRMAALMKRRVIHVLTHDSIGLGEDGPTHQPVEHVASLRLIPGLEVWRPCDTLETAVAWTEAIARTDGPSALVLSRQGLPTQHRDPAQGATLARGAAVVVAADAPRIILIASGSEVDLAMRTREVLEADGISAKVVSMPCRERFLAGEQAWRDGILPPGIPRLAIEAAHPEPWWRIVGDRGDVVGMETFGESAPAPDLFKHFGFTPEAVATRALRLVARTAG